MPRLGRRIFIQNCLACGAVVPWIPARAQQTAARGCQWSGDRTTGTISIVGRPLETTSGDPEKDQALGRALVWLSRLFGERPGFGFVDDTGAKNAFADERSRVAGTWGTVLFGKTLFQDLLAQFEDRGVAVLAVAAHEFGHVAQFRRGIFEALNDRQPTVKRSELHADLLAGYYLGMRKQASPNGLKIRTAGMALYEIGDYEFNNPGHHGTPDERVAAAEYGYRLSKEKVTFDHAFEQGMKWILSHYNDA